MRVLVLGAGLMGVTSAYFLARAGAEVTVLDQRADCALATSHGNGGQLSYTYTDALASPAMLGRLPRLLAGWDPAMHLHLSTERALLDWSLRFLRNCTRQRFQHNTRNVLRLALYSRQQLHALLEEHPQLAFDFRPCGKLHLYFNRAAFEQAKQVMALKREWGGQQEALSAEACMEREPALRACHSLVGAIWAPEDEVGDPYAFSQGLAQLASAEYGVRFHYGTRICSLAVRDRKIMEVVTDHAEWQADTYVLCMGPDSARLARALKIRLPVYPIKGYSVTVPATEAAPEFAITDAERKIMFCRLGERLRIAGIAELTSQQGGFPETRIQQLLAAAEAVLPFSAKYDKLLHQWFGFRPLTPDSAPLMGPTTIHNLYVNTGHGLLGWTLACGSAAIIRDLIHQQEPGIALEGLTLERFY